MIPLWCTARCADFRAWARMQSRGRITILMLAIPLVASSGIGGWYIQRELPYVNWDGYTLPLAGKQLTMRHDAKGSGYFGAPRSGRRQHNGVDIVGRVHAPVYAIRSGYVRISKNQTTGMGNYVVIDHGKGLTSLYGHMSRRFVHAGERVRQGDIIGLVGKTGNARSKIMQPHVHWELQQDGESFDPLSIRYYRKRIQDPAA
jgi:murein DD-endopeptidase MepM/ murein hydrolase activator NlpD